jgi:hypothetical protein
MNTMPLLTMVLATDTACLGSQASSPTSSLSFSPSTPPRALMSAMAISAPLRIWSPAEAYWPVIGPAIATDGTAQLAVDAGVSVAVLGDCIVQFVLWAHRGRQKMRRGCEFDVNRPARQSNCVHCPSFSYRT